MITYICVFIITSLIFKFGERVKKSQRIYCDIFAVSLLCIVAGLRGPGVGTDTIVYLKQCFEAAMDSKNIAEYMDYSWYAASYRVVSQIEIGFTLLVYIVTKIFHSLFAVQFCLQLLILLPLYVGIRKKDNISVWFAMLTYDFLLYNSSFNMMRQAIAVSFTFLALQLWSIRRHRRAIFSVLVGFLFHKSAIIGIGIIFLYEFVQRKGKKRLHFIGFSISQENRHFAIAVIAGILVLIMTGVVSQMLSYLGPLANYASYIRGKIRFMPNQILYRLPAFLIMIYNYRQLDKNTGEGKFYLLMIIYVMIVSQYTSIMPYAGRIAVYFTCYSVISYPMSCSSGRNKSLLKFAMVLHLFGFWWFYYCYLGIDATIPYYMM